MASFLTVTLGVGVSAFLGRAAYVAFQRSRGGMSAAGKAFYNGGFENPMTRREASLIMEIPERSLTKQKIRARHRELISLNHPDRGGSPFVATKINEAKMLLEKTTTS